MRLPEWIRSKNLSSSHNTKKVLRSYGLYTVCEEARCPNMRECFAKPTAMFMILGLRCTRNCSFCSIESFNPEPIDLREPQRVAMAAKEIGLRHVVITSVTRDDLADGGARQFVNTIYSLREHVPDATVEVLTPDFDGKEKNPRLYQRVRPQAYYQRSLNLLRKAKEKSPEIILKSGLMLGLGESREEVLDVLKDLLSTGCEFVTVGQYLRPSKRNLPVTEYVRPEVFEEIRFKALDMGFRYVASAPLVRSSMNAGEMLEH